MISMSSSVGWTPILAVTFERPKRGPKSKLCCAPWLKLPIGNPAAGMVNAVSPPDQRSTSPELSAKV